MTEAPKDMLTEVGEACAAASFECQIRADGILIKGNSHATYVRPERLVSFADAQDIGAGGFRQIIAEIQKEISEAPGHRSHMLTGAPPPPEADTRDPFPIRDPIDYGKFPLDAPSAAPGTAEEGDGGDLASDEPKDGEGAPRPS
jgi:hypothetical protein